MRFLPERRVYGAVFILSVAHTGSADVSSSVKSPVPAAGGVPGLDQRKVAMSVHVELPLFAAAPRLPNKALESATVSKHAANDDNATKMIDVTRKEVFKSSALILKLQAMRRPTGSLELI